VEKIKPKTKKSVEKKKKTPFVWWKQYNICAPLINKEKVLVFFFKKIKQTLYGEGSAKVSLDA
jgi:hypothetical protein